MSSTPSGARIWAERADGKRVDVTEAVQIAYDLVLSSLDFGSGFLSVEDVIPLSELAEACGFDDAAPRSYIKGLAKHLDAPYGVKGAEAAKAQAWLEQKGGSS